MRITKEIGMTVAPRFSVIKPDLHTFFHIDFEWWKQYDNNWRVHLQSCLCPEHQEAFTNTENVEEIDWIDPITAEIFPVDGLQHTLMTHCAKQDGFISSNTTLVDAVFRVFLANGNSPATPLELSSMIGRSPEIILRTLSGDKVYKGIRPCHK
jgi:hypothetical protein